MIRTVLVVLYAVALALGGGAASAVYLTDHIAGLSSLTIGQWVGYPASGTAEADPYSRARAARAGLVALGNAEGLEMRATHDSGGSRLDGRCSYRIAGSVPVTRLWTLHIVDDENRVVSAPEGLRSWTHGRALLRDENADFTLLTSATMEPGNWLHLNRDGPVTFVLTLYDTTLATNTGLRELALPSVDNAGCRR